MAIWQFQVALIPCAVAKSHALTPGNRLNDTQREEIDWWTANHLDSSAMTRISNVLPRGEAWTEDLEVYGDLSDSCLLVFRQQDRIEEVRARFDLRNVSERTFGAVLEFARELECWLVTENNKIVQPVLRELITEIRASSAYSFVSDPHAFLAGLEREGERAPE